MRKDDGFTMGAPTISVVMPIYNGEIHLKAAIESILAQTVTDFEFFIVDDGSTDGTVAIARGYRDPRIQVIEVKEHLGISNVLNVGLDRASGKYIARMDADDLCAPIRFAKQVAYLDAHPDVVLCGTNMGFLNSDRVLQLPSEHEVIRAQLLFSNCISHPTVMIRSHNFSYSALHPHAEDYALWSNMIEHGRFHNLPDSLYTWRIHEQQVSSKHFSIGRASGKQIHRELLTRFGVPFTETELSMHTNFQAYIGRVELDRWLDKLLAHNRATNYYDVTAFARVVANIRTGAYILI